MPAQIQLSEQLGVNRSSPSFSLTFLLYRFQTFGFGQDELSRAKNTTTLWLVETQGCCTKELLIDPRERSERDGSSGSTLRWPRGTAVFLCRS